MNSNLRTQIRNRMNLKETGELLEIWQKNYRAEWTEDAFSVIYEILKERGAEIPEQGKPIYKHDEDWEENKETYGFNEEELKIIDDETPPDFYDPFDALITARRISWMANAMIVLTIAYNLFNFPASMGIIRSYFLIDPESIWVYILTIIVVIINIVVGIVVVYFPLKALSHILRILMEIEFRSRKAI